jgi:uncharacterized protein YbjT (DUF2867 family)
MTLLILGGTGMLGRQIVRKALEDGFQVRCIVRNKRIAHFLREWGAELVYGDLTIPETLPFSFQGASAIIDASTTRLEDDLKIIDVDWYGKLILIEIAKQLNIKRFVFFSILNADQYPSINLMQQKISIEKILESSGVPYTIFKCAGFYQALISQYAIPILDRKTIWTTSEAIPISYIDTLDAAKLCVDSLSLKETEFKTLSLLGPKAYTSDYIINLCESLSGQKAKIKKTPIFLIEILREVAGFFEWTYKISDRLAFVQFLQNVSEDQKISAENKRIFALKDNDLLVLDDYLKEYFEIMLLNLENLQIDLQNKQKDLII